MSKYIIQSKKLWFLALLSFLFFGINSSSAATSLASRLQGYILLQVESVGEAWYIIPKEQKMVYMKDGSVAYQIMREVSLGITNANLAKIPVGIEARFNDVDTDGDGLSDNLEKGLDTDPNKADTDNDGFSDGEEIKNNFSPISASKLVYDNNLVNRLRGYILLQVEKQGQAWYLNPKDGKRYYMQDGPAAYNIMRYLSLGITNKNLNLIPKSARVFNTNTSNNSSSNNQGNQGNGNSTSTPPSTPPGNNPGGGGGGGGGSSRPPTPSNDQDNDGYKINGSSALDCNDSNPSIHPGATEICGNNVDEDCSGTDLQCLVPDYDQDNDNYDSIASGGTDCNDSNPLINPGMTEVPGNNVDDNCNAQIDETSTPATDNSAPSVPSNLGGSTSGTQVVLTWTQSTDNVGVYQYDVERRIGTTGTFQNIVSINATSYTNISLSPSTSYSYRIKARDLAGNSSGYSNIFTITTNTATDNTPPSVAPANLVATPSGTQISLTWTAATDNVGIYQYHLERSTDNSIFSEIATPNTTSYTNTGLLSATTYYYRVRARDAALNYSLFSNTAQATTPVAVTPPSTSVSITGVTGTMSNGQTVTISGSGFGLPATIISWDDFESGTIGSSLGAPKIGPTWTTLGGVAPAAPHYSNVKSHSGNVSAKVVWNEPGIVGTSINAFGWTEQGPFYNFYMSYWRYHDPATTEIALPRLPDGSWPSNVYNHKQLYTFSEGVSETQQWMPFLIPGGQTSWGTYVQDDPQVLHNYYSAPRYADTTYTWDRWEAYIAWENPIEDNDTYYETWLNGAMLGQFLNLDYSHVSNGNSIDDFRLGYMFQGWQNQEYVRSYFDDVYLATSRARIELGNSSSFSTCTHREIQVPINWTASQVSFKFNPGSFTSGQTAYLYVVDSNGTVNSTGYPITISGTAVVDQTPPTTPTSLSATVSGTQSTLSWTASTDNTAVTGYQILRSTTTGGPYTILTTSNTTSYSDTNLTTGTTYYYVVKAYDAASNYSSNSNQATAQIQSSTSCTPITITNLTSGIGTGDPQSTASVTATAGRVLYLTLGMSFYSGYPDDSLTISGLGATWTKLSTINADYRRKGWLYRGVGGSGTGPITINYTGVGTPQELGWVLDEASGLNLTTPDTNTVAVETAFTAPVLITATTNGTPSTCDATYSSLQLQNQIATNVETGWSSLGQTSTGSLGVRKVATAWDDNHDTSHTWSWVGGRNASAFITILKSSGSATPAPTGDTTAPTAPTNLTATPSTNQISLNWTASYDATGVSQYLIETSNGGNYTQVGTSNSTSYTVSGLTANTAYFCRARAQDATGNMSLYSNVATVTTNATTPPPSTSVSISGVSDNTISHEQVITISGSGFGTKIAVSGIVGPPVLWDNFENGVNGALVAKYPASPWDRVRSDNTSGPRYYQGAIDSSMGVRTGSGIVNGVTAGTTRVLIEDDEYRNLYMDYYIKGVKGVGLKPRSSKPVMYWSANGGVNGNDGPNSGFWQITQGSQDNPDFVFAEYSCGNDPFSIAYTNMGFDEFTTPRHVQIEFRRPTNIVGSPDYHGSLRIWYDGALVTNRSTFGSYSCDPDINFIDNLFIGHYQDSDSYNEPRLMWISCPANARCNECPVGSTGCSVDNPNWLPARQDEFFYDNIYIDKSIARVEIGNASTYGASTRREVQVPTSWGSSIQITVNKGGFSSGQTAYLYVMDSNGAVNSSGYPVTIN